MRFTFRIVLIDNGQKTLRKHNFKKFNTLTKEKREVLHFMINQIFMNNYEEEKENKCIFRRKIKKLYIVNFVKKLIFFLNNISIKFFLNKTKEIIL